MRVNEPTKATASRLDRAGGDRQRDYLEIATLRQVALRAHAAAEVKRGSGQRGAAAALRRVNRLTQRLEVLQQGLRETAPALFTPPQMTAEMDPPATRRLARSGAKVVLGGRDPQTGLCRLRLERLGPVDQLELHCRSEDVNLLIALIEDAAAVLAGRASEISVAPRPARRVQP